MRVFMCCIIVCLITGCGGAALPTPRGPSAIGNPGIDRVPSSTPLPPLRVGDTGTLPDGQTVTLRAVENPVAAPRDTPVPNKTVIGADIEWCAGPHPAGGSVSVSGLSFQLALADNTRTGTSLGQKTPSFINTILTPDTCNRGWVTFVAPLDPRPVAITVSTLRWLL